MTLALMAGAGCRTALEQSARTNVASAAPGSGQQTTATTTPAASRAGQKGSLDAYTQLALENSPELQAEYQEWRAATFRISGARRLPEPTVSYAYFVRSVETRVGPQQHRLSIQQSFPWPTRLSSAADAAAHISESAKRRYEAAALDLMQRVAESYWQLWLIDRTVEVERDQAKLLEQLSASARARLEIGQGSLADVSQLDLRRSRLSDELSGLAQARRRARAKLIALLGVEHTSETPVLTEPPRLLKPAEARKELLNAAVRHPRITSMRHMAQAEQERAKSNDAESLPSFTLGADYIVTGEAQNPSMPESGKDAVLVMLGIKLPIWQGLYGDQTDEALAKSAAYSARESAARNQAAAAIETTLSNLEDSRRRAKLYRETLLPQAEAALGSVLGSYQTGNGTVAAVLLSQTDLLELTLGVSRAQAEHGMAWAQLEAIVGRPVRAEEVQ